MISKESLQSVIEEILSGSDKFVVDIMVQPTNRISVYLDSDTSLTIHDCQEISRSIESRLDREKEDFDLTVSSAGLDRPVKLLRQFRKIIGKKIELFRNDGKEITGTLVKADENSLELEYEVKKQKKEIIRETILIPLSEIKTAKLIIKFGK
ncbi:MAG: ribosome assembly cofactor RimP [Bacteroidales bacterium]|jgi:ribosome maturation factor RimP